MYDVTIDWFVDLRRKIDDEKLAIMYNRGDKVVSIARYFNCTKRGVIKAVARLNLKRRPPHRPKKAV